MSVFTDDDGWVLEPASAADIESLSTWFPDQAACDLWSGPGMRFPFRQESFREDLLWPERPTFALRDPQRRFTAFGQVYVRLGRINLARLAVEPGSRGRGVGRRLVAMLMAAGRELYPLDEYGLFVYRCNTAAYRCYTSVGFTVRDCPADERLADQCYYMTCAVDRGDTQCIVAGSRA